MSSQKGNISRTRPQKYKNSMVFKNNLHDKSKRTKAINNLTISNVCDRCKSILEWKIKYKKYKLLKQASTCCKCHNKCVKEPYHTICQPCSDKIKVCPKCGKDKETADDDKTNDSSNGVDGKVSNVESDLDDDGSESNDDDEFSD